jgi:hypothetical protein
VTNPYDPPRASLEAANSIRPGIRAAIGSALSILSGRLIAISIALTLPLLLLETRLDALLAESLWLSFGLSLVATMVIFSLERGVFYAAASAAWDHREASTVSLLREAVTAWPRVFAASWLSALATLVALVLLVIPGIYFGVRLSFADVIAFERRTTALEACKRSGGFVSGRFWKALVLPLPLLISALAVEAGGGAISAAMQSDTIAVLVVRSISSLIGSLSAASYWFFYKQQTEDQPVRT